MCLWCGTLASQRKARYLSFRSFTAADTKSFGETELHRFFPGRQHREQLFICTIRIIGDHLITGDEGHARCWYSPHWFQSVFRAQIRLPIQALTQKCFKVSTAYKSIPNLLPVMNKTVFKCCVSASSLPPLKLALKLWLPVLMGSDVS